MKVSILEIVTSLLIILAQGVVGMILLLRLNECDEINKRNWIYMKDFVKNVCSFKEDEELCLRMAKAIEIKMREEK